jgi:SAM-dependent methyltransferase
MPSTHSQLDLPDPPMARDSREAGHPTLACPRCRRSLIPPGTVAIKCDTCDFIICCQDGIWRALPAERARHFQKFVEEYETVRQAEGRGSADSSYYLALPYRDTSGKLSKQWRIRSRSYRALEHLLLKEIESRRSPGGLDLLDVGAGNGWLSYRVALRGYRPVAVDLLVNDRDGLGAARHFLAALPHSFPRFQAEMDRLPFADAQFDIVLFNASLHYSVDYPRTLNEALRCLRSDGDLLILDSPVYRREESGLVMRNECHQRFARLYGFRSDTIPSHEFLTFDLLNELGRELRLTWRVVRPWYGLSWALRPLKSKLLRKREPSQFLILWGKRKSH